MAQATEFPTAPAPDPLQEHRGTQKTQGPIPPRIALVLPPTAPEASDLLLAERTTGRSPSISTSPPPSPPPITIPADLPDRIVLENRRDVRKIFRKIEEFLARSGKIAGSPEEILEPLERDLVRLIGPVQPVTLYPKAIYAFVLREGIAGKEQSEISEALRRAHHSGALKTYLDHP